MQSAAKVGMLVVVFVALMIGSFALLGKSLFSAPADRYYADMPDAGGLTEGAPILMAGVKIGIIGPVKLMSPTVARVALDLIAGTKVPEGSEVIVPTSLIGIGQNPLTIVPPTLSTGRYASKQDVLKGHKGSPLDGILPNSGETVAEMTRTMVAVRKLLEDKKLQGKVSELMQTSNQTLEKFGTLAASINVTLSQNQANIAKAMSAAAKAMEDVHRITSRFAVLAEDGKLKDNANGILVRIQSMEKHADELVVGLNNLVNDPKLREPTAKIVANMAEITNTGKTIAANTAEMTKNGSEISKNGIEISKNFTVVSQKAIALTDKANDLAANAIDIEKQLKGVLDKVGGFFNHAPSGGGIKLSSELDLIRQTDPGQWRTDLTFSSPLADGTLYAGIYDAFETNKLTIQIGKSVKPDLQARYGIYASKPGFGVDSFLSKNLTLRSDAWDINSPRLDLRAKYKFGNGVYGWLGADRVFHGTKPTFGIGIRH